MAVKSLGDIALTGNDRAMTFLQEEVDEVLDGATATGTDWAREIIDLYLRG